MIPWALVGLRTRWTVGLAVAGGILLTVLSAQAGAGGCRDFILTAPSGLTRPLCDLADKVSNLELEASALRLEVSTLQRALADERSAREALETQYGDLEKRLEAEIAARRAPESRGVRGR